MDSKPLALIQLYKILIEEMIKNDPGRLQESMPETFWSEDYVFQVVVIKKRKIQLVEDDG